MKLTLQKYSPSILILFVFGLALFLPNLALAQSSGGPNGLQKVLWFVVSEVFGRMAGLAGTLLDVSIIKFVIGFGTLYTEGGVGTAVDLVWVSVRDIFNITFIFGLVYIGFKMILNSDDAGTKRWLVNLLIAALLVNFSLYITKFVIDVSNTLASEIALSGAFDLDADGELSISTTFMDNMGVNSTLGAENKAFETSGEGGAYGYIFGSLILFIISAFVFAAGAMLLLIRFTVLLIYMVFSPFMFIGWVFPQLQHLTSQYWKGFLGRAFFAPIYLLLLYVSAKIITDYFEVSNAKNGASQFGVLLTGGGDKVSEVFLGTFPPFIIACIFLVASIVVANKMGANGATAVMSTGRNITNRAKRGVQQAANRTIRRTAAVAALPVTKATGAVARSGAYNLGRGLDSAISSMQKSENKLIKAASRSVLVDDAARGASSKLKNTKAGMQYTMDEKKARVSAISNRSDGDIKVDRGTQASFHKEGGQAIRNQKGDYVDASSLAPEEVKRLKDTYASQGLTSDEYMKTVAAGAQIFDPAQNKVVNVKSLSEETLEKAKVAQDKAIADMQSAVGQMSIQQLENMYDQQPARFNQVIKHLKDNQFEKLQDSEKLNTTQKGHIYAQRVESIVNTIGQSINEQGEIVGEAITDKVQYLSTKQLEVLGDSFIKSNVENLTQTQLEGIRKSDKFTDTQKNGYYGDRMKKQLSLSKPNEPDYNVSKLFNYSDDAKNPQVYKKAKKAAELAYIPFEVYIPEPGKVNPETIKQLDGGIMEEIFSKKTMNAGQRNQIRKAIVEYGNDDAKEYLDSPIGQRDWGGKEQANKEPEKTTSANNPTIDTSANVASAREYRDTK